MRCVSIHVIIVKIHVIIMMSKLSQDIFRVSQYLVHLLRARNTLGHGIHSPSIYEMVRMIIHDDNAYYCYEAIETERTRLLGDNSDIYINDLGTGHSRRCKVREVAQRSLERKQVAQMLMRIVNHKKYKTILELGTCLGITTAYLASPDSGSEVTTMEGSEELAKKAEQLWEQLGINNIQLIRGNIDETLPDYLDELRRESRSLDFCFIDANHSYEPTMRYYRQVAACCKSSSMVVIDDIYHSPEMLKAWREICNENGVTATIDCYHCGLVMFDPQYEKKEYVLRYF